MSIRDALKVIAQQVYDNNLSLKVHNLFDEFDSSPDGLVLTQSVYTGLTPQINYLKNGRKKLARRQVLKLIEVYRELSGHYEKLIRLVVGLIVILEDKEIHYTPLAKRSLYSNVGQIGKTYPSLTENFSITLRNSISHSQYFLSLSNKTVRFVDRHSEVTLSFKEFFKSCRSLMVVVLALVLLRHVVGFAQAVHVRKTLDTINRK